MKDYVDILGAGRTNSIISGTSGTILTFSAVHCTVMDMGINIDYGTLGADSQAIVSSGADSILLRCDITVAKSAGDYIMKALAVSGGSFRLSDCYFTYSITGTTTGTALIQPAISHTGVSTIFLLHNNEITMTCNDTNDELVGFETIAGSIGSWLLENNIITITATNTATGLWLHGTATGATIEKNRLLVTAPTCYGFYIDSNAGGAVVDSRHNQLIIIDGVTGKSAYVDTGDTWNSTFDKITATGGYAGSLGTVNLVSSPMNGDFSVTGELSATTIIGELTGTASGNLTSEDDPLSLHLDQTTPQTVINGAPTFANGVKLGKVYPSADSTTAVQINKADGTTNVLNVDTTNGNVGIGTTVPTAALHLKAGTAAGSTAPLKLTTGTVNTTPEAGTIEYNNTFHLTNSDATRRHIVTAPNTTKVTASAPHTNDGYIVINIGGTDVKVMTTA